MSERAAGVSAERKRRGRPLEKERRKRRDRMERVGLRGLSTGATIPDVLPSRMGITQTGEDFKSIERMGNAPFGSA
jgi:hypothetical protein